MVKQGKPNAVVISAAGIVSMAFIVVLAIYSSGGRLAEGLTAAAIFGFVGIVAQVVMMRVATMVLGVNMSGCLESDRFSHESLMVAAAQFSLGLVVAVAIL
jgi:hypothetical protein